jgi:hypothetical protein
MKIRQHCLLIVLLLLTGTLCAQQLQVNRVELNGDNVILHYVLLDTVPGRSFTVNLYASRDNYINPLENLTGDYGPEIKPGIGKKVIWNAKQELGATFDGKVSVEIRARVYVPFIVFDNFDKIKRGKPKEITWRGGSRQNTLNFELYNKRDEKVTTVIANINAAAGNTSLSIPSDVKAGKGYRFKIVDSKNKDQVIYSSRFAIKRKVPLLVLALPVVAGGAAVVMLGGEGGGGLGEIENPKPPPGD